MQRGFETNVTRRKQHLKNTYSMADWASRARQHCHRGTGGTQEAPKLHPVEGRVGPIQKNRAGIAPGQQTMEWQGCNLRWHSWQQQEYSICCRTDDELHLHFLLMSYLSSSGLGKEGKAALPEGTASRHQLAAAHGSCCGCFWPALCHVQSCPPQQHLF